MASGHLVSPVEESARGKETSAEQCQHSGSPVQRKSDGGVSDRNEE